MNHKANEEIVEKRLGIPPDYQYKALNHSNFLQSNWHANKLTAVEYVIPNMNKTMRALDLGSGSGNFEFAFANKLNHIVAVDYHREALDFIKNVLIDKNISNVSLQYSDIRSLENKQDLGLFDLITLIDVIEHIRDAEAENMVSYLKKITKPGGKVCIITPNYHSLWTLIEKVLDKVTIVPHFDGQQHLAQYHSENLSSLFERHGFITKRLCTFNTISYLIPIKSISSIICKAELFSGAKVGNLLLGVFENA